jgi:hypothetical protein
MHDIGRTGIAVGSLTVRATIPLPVDHIRKPVPPSL